jgi:hypothetical protein
MANDVKLIGLELDLRLDLRLYTARLRLLTQVRPRDSSCLQKMEKGVSFVMACYGLSIFPLSWIMIPCDVRATDNTYPVKVASSEKKRRASLSGLDTRYIEVLIYGQIHREVLM